MYAVTAAPPPPYSDVQIHMDWGALRSNSARKVLLDACSNYELIAVNCYISTTAPQQGKQTNNPDLFLVTPEISTSCELTVTDDNYGDP